MVNWADAVNQSIKEGMGLDGEQRKEYLKGIFNGLRFT